MTTAAAARPSSLRHRAYRQLGPGYARRITWSFNVRGVLPERLFERFAR